MVSLIGLLQKMTTLANSTGLHNINGMQANTFRQIHVYMSVSNTLFGTTNTVINQASIKTMSAHWSNTTSKLYFSLFKKQDLGLAFLLVVTIVSNKYALLITMQPICT